MSLVLAPQIESAVRTATCHRRATCWNIVRQDVSNITYRITDHPRPLELHDGLVYSPADGWEGSATRKVEAATPSDKDVRGLVSLNASVIGEAVLRSGQLRNALVTEYLVDWGFPWRQPLESAVYWVRDVEHDGDTYRAELADVVSWLDQPKGEVWGPTCRVELFSVGNGKCNLSPTGFRQNNRDVLSVDSSEPRTTFTIVCDTGALPDWAADGYGDDGQLVWSVGDNQGVVSTIRTHTDLGGNTASFVLMEPVPFDVQVGDRANYDPGCNKEPGIFDPLGHCRNKFDNLINFQGEPVMPGPDRLFRGAPLHGTSD